MIDLTTSPGYSQSEFTELRTVPPLPSMTHTTPTCLWNHSATPRELSQAIGWDAVHATCNPVIALTALKADPATWGATQTLATITVDRCPCRVRGTDGRCDRAGSRQ